MANPFALLALNLGAGLLGGVVSGKMQQQEEQKAFLTGLVQKNPQLVNFPGVQKDLAGYYGKDVTDSLVSWSQIEQQRQQQEQALLLGGGMPGTPGQGGGQAASTLPPGMSLSGKVGGLTVRRSGLEPPGLGEDINAQLRGMGVNPRTANPEQIQQALQARNNSQANLTGAQEKARLGAQLSPDVIQGQAAKAGAVSGAKARALLAKDILGTQTAQEAALTGARVGAEQATRFMPPDQAANLGVPYGQTPQDVAGQGLLSVSPGQREKLASLAPAQTALETIKNLSQAVNTFSATGRLLKAPLNRLAALTQSDPQAVALANTVPQLRLILRAFGEGARMSDQDISQLQDAAPRVTDSLDVARVKLQNLESLLNAISQARVQSLGPIKAGGSATGSQPPAGPGQTSPAGPVQVPPLPGSITKASEAVKFYMQQGFDENRAKEIVRGLLQGGGQ